MDWFRDALTVGSGLVLLGALARTGTLLWSANAYRKFVASFLKSDWQLADYPVLTSRLPPDLSSRDNPLGETWVAYIENGALAGFGPTPEAAVRNLSGAFGRYKAARESTPRPGLHWPEEWQTGEFADPQVFL